MPTFATESGGDDAPPRRRARVADHEGGGTSSSLEDESMRELNRLLEAALRMGGDGGVDASALLFDAAGGGGPSYPAGEDSGLSILNLSSNEAASWRLDTARRLSSVSANFGGMHYFRFLCVGILYSVRSWSFVGLALPGTSMGRL